LSHVALFVLRTFWNLVRGAQTGPKRSWGSFPILAALLHRGNQKRGDGYQQYGGTAESTCAG
jgi:hypothetical protein